MYSFVFIFNNYKFLMSNSEAVLKALENIIKTPLSFVVLIVLKEKPYFLCIGRH